MNWASPVGFATSNVMLGTQEYLMSPKHRYHIQLAIVYVVMKIVTVELRGKLHLSEDCYEVVQSR